MQKIKYPLIVSDFDGTLLRSDGTVAEETKETIAEYVRDGGKFVLCSGRMTPSIIRQAKNLGLVGLVSAYNGAEIADIQSGERIFQGYLEREEAVKICEKMEELGLQFHVYEGDDFYSNSDNQYFQLYEKVCQVKGVAVTDMPLSKFVIEKKINVVKVVALMAVEDRDRIYALLDESFGCDYEVVRSAKFLVEVCDKRYSKGTALAFVAEKSGIPLSKTVAIGDNQNDLAMLKVAGVGLAVANAEESLKGKVPFYPFSNDENAVGKIIEEYGYESIEG